MLFAKAALVFSSLVVLTVSQDTDASSKGLSPGRGRSPNPNSPGKLMSKRDLEKRCTGTCETCFGSGYTECPNSDIYCYLPGDATYGLDSCYSDGSSSGDTTATATASAPASTSTDTSGTTGVDDICSQAGATCTSCFGPTYLQCPDGYHCYDPSDPLYDTCPDDSSSSSGGSSTTTTSCADMYGDGNIPCGSDGCYNPDAGESCCSGGYYCEAGYTCSSTVGKCSYGSGLTGGSSTSSGDDDITSTSSYDFGLATSTSAYVFSTAASTPTTTGSISSSTGVNQFSGESSDGQVLAVARGLLVAAGAAVLVL